MPIVVITSSTDRASVERAFEVGATSFLTKPVNWGLFGHHIDYLIRLSRGSDLARVTMHHAEAVARAKDAVIALLAARVRQHSTELISAARQALRPREVGIDGASATEFARIVLDETTAIAAAFDATLPHMHGIVEQIVVDDRPVAVDRMLQAACDEVAELARARGVSIEMKKPVGRPVLRCDEAAIVRALTNVLRNAVQHSQAGAPVEVSTEQRDDNVLAVAIADSGTGADPDHIADCLRPLDCLAPDRLPADGPPAHTGLGLPIAKGIAQAHGGMLEISTAPGQGTTAVFVFPADLVEVKHEFAA
jgi:signal transduction histidine kinase